MVFQIYMKFYCYETYTGPSSLMDNPLYGDYNQRNLLFNNISMPIYGQQDFSNSL